MKDVPVSLQPDALFKNSNTNTKTALQQPKHHSNNNNNNNTPWKPKTKTTNHRSATKKEATGPEKKGRIFS